MDKNNKFKLINLVKNSLLMKMEKFKLFKNLNQNMNLKMSLYQNMLVRMDYVNIANKNIHSKLNIKVNVLLMKMEINMF